MHIIARLLVGAAALALLAACAPARPADRAAPPPCPSTAPVRATPPEDAAVDGAPAEGGLLRQWRPLAMGRGVVGDGRGSPPPRGRRWAQGGLVSPGGGRAAHQRLDAPAPPLEAHVPCCYPTRFQATGLRFPTAGCWEVTATADGRGLSFVVEVAP